MSMPSSLSIVTLGVADLERSIAFYTALGWRRASSSVEGVIAWFDLGGPWLGVFDRAALAADSGLEAGVAAQAEEPGFSGVTFALNVGSEAEVTAALEVAVAAGARVTLPALTTEYGVFHGCFADPDGYVWEPAFNPAFPIRDGRTVIP